MSLRKWAKRRIRKQNKKSMRHEHQSLHKLETMENRLLLSGTTPTASDFLQVSSAWFERVAEANPGGGDVSPSNSNFDKQTITIGGKEYNAVNNQLIVKLTESATRGISGLAQVDGLLGLNNLGGKVIKGLGLAGMVLVEADSPGNASSLADALAADSQVEYVSPNGFSYKRNFVPNDPLFEKQWGPDNPKRGFDIDAPQAWDIVTGDPDQVVGIIDGGIDVEHPDLKDNIWINPGEIPNDGIDNDGNGFIDDVNGYNFVSDTGKVTPDDHGTHVAGTVAADGNNGIGVAGVAFDTKLMSLQIFEGFAGGTADVIMSAINYSTMMRQMFDVDILITNNSWGGGFFDQAIFDAVSANNDAGLLFVAAAGNESANNDFIASYPDGFDIPNVISVGALSKRGARASFSNYGPTAVDIFAPGHNIISTVPDTRFRRPRPEGQYEKNSGTSMASPHVAGIAALLYAYDPTLTAAEIKDAILSSATPLRRFHEKWAVTGGHANAYGALMQVMGTQEADPWESNNSIAEVDAQDDHASGSPNLGDITARRELWGVNMVNDPTEIDWFRFEMRDFGTVDSYVGLEFDHDLGNLDLFVYAGDGVTMVGSSTSTTDDEMVSLDGLAPGTYYVQVREFDAAKTHPNYKLIVDPALGLADAYEANDLLGDVAAQAVGDLFSSNLGVATSARKVTKLNTLDATPDIFQFELLQDVSQASAHVRIKFKHNQGDLDLNVYDFDGNLVGFSASRNNNETIFLKGLTKGKYFVEVVPFAGAANPNYKLKFKTQRPPKDTAGNGRAKATVLKNKIMQSVEGYVGVGDEYDYYEINVGDDPRALTATLTNLTGPADLFLLDNRANVLASSEIPGTDDDVIGPLPFPYILTRGRYYLVVAGDVTNTASYTLNVELNLLII